MNNTYVIKGQVKGRNVYFTRFEDIVMFGTDFKARVLANDISGATLFEDISKVENVCHELGSNFKIFPVCPKCHQEYDGYPAVSRDDNKTKICDKCGLEESIIAFVKYKKEATN